MNEKLSKFVKTHFTNEKNDLFSCFITKGNGMIKKNGYNAMVTMQSWMFLSSFENMRKKILDDFSIIDLLHMDNMVMGIAFGTSATVFRKKIDSNYIGTYNQITLKDINKNGTPNSFPVSNNRFNQIPTTNFSKIPGSPIAYWVSENIVNAFLSNKPLKNFAQPKQGLSTTDNNRFVRIWTEVSFNKIGFNYTKQDAINSNIKWFPLNKGGEYRKWFGNNEYLVNFQHNGFEIKNSVLNKYPYLKTPDFVVKNQQYYFKENGTWSAISSGKISVRYSSKGYIISNAGMAIFCDTNNLKYIIAFMNSKCVSEKLLKVINQTLNFNAGDIEKLPLLLKNDSKEIIINLSNSNIKTEKTDWDSYETSWDFKRNPLV